MKKIYLLTLILFCLVFSVDGQIINMESKRITTDTIGFSGKLGVSLSAAKFTQSFVTADFNGHIQWKTHKNLYILVGDFQVVNAGGESFNNSGFGHFRYNRKFNDVIRSELFTQIQYNEVTKIRKRVLNGIGLRFKLSQYETAKIYWGIAYMYEYEEVNNPDVLNEDSRLSSYFTFTLAPVETITFRNTTYIQPNLGDFNDYRLSNTTNLNFGITDNLKFTTSFSFLYDSRPPVDVPSVNYQIRNGLNYRLL